MIRECDQSDLIVPEYLTFEVLWESGDGTFDQREVDATGFELRDDLPTISNKLPDAQVGMDSSVPRQSGGKQIRSNGRTRSDPDRPRIETS
ncbi:MAG: hypothetical protein WKF67_05500 [Rubrobacteraceae bacterium]